MCSVESLAEPASESSSQLPVELQHCMWLSDPISLIPGTPLSSSTYAAYAAYIMDVTFCILGVPINMSVA